MIVATVLTKVRGIAVIPGTSIHGAISTNLVSYAI